MDPIPTPNQAPDRARELAQQKSPRAADATEGRRATAYTPKPDFLDDASGDQKEPAPSRWGWWITIITAAALLCGGGLALHHGPVVPNASSDHMLVLTAADVDQAATAEARAMLARGEIPASLAHASDETRREVADGRQSLYTKQLLPPDSPKDFAIHVTVTEAGSVIGEDVLTSAHSRGTTFPAGPSTPPVHFHFAVESAGPTGTITCSVNSTDGHSVHTAPMPTGGSGDLEAQAQ